MPVTIIEAQSCGLPVIASRTGYIPEMIRENEGIIVAPGNENELKQAILKMQSELKNYSSTAIRERAVKQYSFRAVGEKLNSIYLSAIQPDAE